MVINGYRPHSGEKLTSMDVDMKDGFRKKAREI
jgi:hypothetical protein